MPSYLLFYLMGSEDKNAQLVLVGGGRGVVLIIVLYVTMNSPASDLEKKLLRDNGVKGEQGVATKTFVRKAHKS